MVDRETLAKKPIAWQVEAILNYVPEAGRQEVWSLLLDLVISSLPETGREAFTPSVSCANQPVQCAEQERLHTLATPSPEAAGSAEAPVAAGEVNRELEKIADWWEPHWRGAGITPTADWLIKEIKAHAEASFEAVTAAQAKGDARAQDFRAGIEVAAKVARAARFQSYGPQDHPERIAEAIEALAPPAGAGEWQPMDTAPKDGTEIIGYRPDQGVFVFRWAWMEEFVPKDQHGDPTEPYDEDFACWWHDRWDWMEGELTPTLWQPLPAAPGDGG